MLTVEDRFGIKRGLSQFGKIELTRITDYKGEFHLEGGFLHYPNSKIG